MPGSPGMPLPADSPAGARLALVIATGTYADAGLRQLRAPAADAADLAEVLADPRIGGFTVTTKLDQPAHLIRLAVEDFLAGRGTNDLLLVYLSCHGLLDDYRRLYFAATDTRKDRLGATGVESAWVLDQLEHCRARRQILILDSCFSGAFSHGAKGRADLDLRDRFLGQGRGRVVLTASTATEYSFEGHPTDRASPAGSVFTAALVQGLRTGAADADRDGYITVDDAYAYVFDHVQAAGAAQTPQRWLYGAEGRIVLARNPTGAVAAPVALPESLQAGLDSPHPHIRIGAVTELGAWLHDSDPARVLAARRRLREVADADNPRVADAARALLATTGRAEAPTPRPGNQLHEERSSQASPERTGAVGRAPAEPTRPAAAEPVVPLSPPPATPRPSAVTPPPPPPPGLLRPPPPPPRMRPRQPFGARWMLFISIGMALSIVAVALLFPAFSSNTGPNTGISGGGPTAASSAPTGPAPAPSADQVVKIGMIAPLSGVESGEGIGMENSVKLAVDQANSQGTVPGVTFQMEPEDDQATVSVSQQVTQTLINDPQVLGIVGTLNSSTAQADLPTLSQAGLLMVSPANTSPSLTQGPNWLNLKIRPYNDYFRIPTTDAVQGPYAARYLYNTLHITKVATVDDHMTYGTGLVTTFTQEFSRLGGQIVDNDVVQVGQKDFSAVVQRIKNSGAGMVYFGGQYPEAAPLSSQLKQNGANIPMMGGDGNEDPTYIQLGGPHVNGDYATTVGAPPDQGPSATFRTLYENTYHADTYSTYGAAAYDATTAIIGAVQGAKTAGVLLDRRHVTSTEQGVAFTGTTGPIAFDQYGDDTNRVLTVSQVRNGIWTYISSGNFQ